MLAPNAANAVTGVTMVLGIIGIKFETGRIGHWMIG